MQDKPTIAIIGGTGDLGSGLAKLWARAGYPVVIGSRTKEKADAVARELSARRRVRAGRGQHRRRACRPGRRVVGAVLHPRRDDRGDQGRVGRQGRRRCRRSAGAAEGVDGAAACGRIACRRRAARARAGRAGRLGVPQRRCEEAARRREGRLRRARLWRRCPGARARDWTRRRCGHPRRGWRCVVQLRRSRSADLRPHRHQPAL